MRLADQPGSTFSITQALGLAHGLPPGSMQAAMRLANQQGSGYNITQALELARGPPIGS
eukprot:SAG31_NODE_35911_length_318_cov_0.940639_1_plen_58_part_10